MEQFRALTREELDKAIEFSMTSEGGGHGQLILRKGNKRELCAMGCIAEVRNTLDKTKYAFSDMVGLYEYDQIWKDNDEFWRQKEFYGKQYPDNMNCSTLALLELKKRLGWEDKPEIPSCNNVPEEIKTLN